MNHHELQNGGYKLLVLDTTWALRNFLEGMVSLDQNTAVDYTPHELGSDVTTTVVGGLEQGSSLIIVSQQMAHHVARRYECPDIEGVMRAVGPLVETVYNNLAWMFQSINDTIGEGLHQAMMGVVGHQAPPMIRARGPELAYFDWYGPRLRISARERPTLMYMGNPTVQPMSVPTELPIFARMRRLATQEVPRPFEPSATYPSNRAHTEDSWLTAGNIPAEWMQG